MKKILTLPKKYLAFFILAVAVVFTAGFQVTNLRASGNINGFGWADGTGWISLNCSTGGVNGADICGLSNYGLNYGTGGAITGYAWSDNLGWIQFDGGCPANTAANGSHPCAARVVNTPAPQLRGFAKITNFFSPGSYCKNPSTAAGNNCGWSNPESAGYISLSSANDQDTAVAGFQESTGSAPYSVVYDNGALNGFGWNPLLGWVQFTGTPTINPVTVLLEPADGTITTCTATPITLAWSSTNATSCSGSWPGATTLPTTGTADVVGAGTYTVTCNGVTSNAVTIVTTTDPSSCVTLMEDASYCELDDTTSLLSWTTPVGASCVASWDSSIVFSTPGPSTISVFDNEVGNNPYYVTCNGVASNTVIIHVDAVNSTPTCMDDTADPPVLSIEPGVMCLEYEFEYFNLIYTYDGNTNSSCSGSWGETDLPASGTVTRQLPTPSTTTSYTVTCDGMVSNQVTFKVYPVGSSFCDEAGCTDPLASNYDSAAMVDDGSCQYVNPIPGCPDPQASNYDPAAPASNGTGSCLYNGSGKPIIEEF